MQAYWKGIVVEEGSLRFLKQFLKSRKILKNPSTVVHLLSQTFCCCFTVHMLSRFIALTLVELWFQFGIASLHRGPEESCTHMKILKFLFGRGGWHMSVLEQNQSGLDNEILHWFQWQKEKVPFRRLLCACLCDCFKIGFQWRVIASCNVRLGVQSLGAFLWFIFLEIKR